MELNAKISSLEDEVKLLKGEVKLILSEIRTAILNQNNPFANKDPLVLSVDPGASESRPPIRVVKAAPEESDELGPSVERDEDEDPVLSWSNEEEEEESLLQPVAEAPSPPPPAPPRPRRAPAPTPSPQSVEQPAASEPVPISAAPPSPPPAQGVRAAVAPQAAADVRTWSLVKVAGLAVWAEEALKQIGPERLQVLLDLCEFAGYLPTSAKEALTKVMSLGLLVEERTTPPSLNECLVVLYQLDALMRGEEPLTVLRSQAVAS